MRVGSATALAMVHLALLIPPSLVYSTGIEQASSLGLVSVTPSAGDNSLLGDDRPLTVEVARLPFQVKVTVEGEPAATSIALAAFEKQKRRDRRRSARAQWISGLKNKLLRLPFFNIRVSTEGVFLEFPLNVMPHYVPLSGHPNGASSFSCVAFPS